MAEFTLPKNSKIEKGEHFSADESAENIRTFHVYRYDPSDDSNPRVDTYEIDMDKCCLLYTSPSPRDVEESRMPSSA